MLQTTPTFDTLKARLKATWMAGDFGQIAQYSESTAEQFLARRRLAPGLRVLDAACGTGNLAIPAAKAGAVVTGVDIAPNLLEQARARAQGAGLAIRFDEGDVEQLPYPDASFDLVLSMFGAMFAPRPERVAAELVRVCRPGGMIALANWTPRGFIGQLFEVTRGHVPPPPELPSAMLWGDEQTVRARLRDGIAELQLTPLLASLRFPFPVPDTVEFFRRYYGPTERAFAALPEDRQAQLRRDLEDLWAQHNRGAEDTTEVEAEYLEVVATRA
ncbi:class I SAM-dependent methyltransferase [Candidatus Methylocalor cossyra]|uniref:Methyltransferase type 11 n=1 Tax=Candidatus Methylocalor cossyra TaxID=3108543 RepID=A0ABM9NIN2_9GAMM